MGSTNEERDKAWICFQPREKNNREWNSGLGINFFKKVLEWGLVVKKLNVLCYGFNWKKKRKTRASKFWVWLEEKKTHANNYISS